MKGRKHTLALEALEDRQHTTRQVIVEQNEAGIEVVKSKPSTVSHQGLKDKLAC